MGEYPAPKVDSLSTQIGGKYTPANTLIFPIKKNLQEAGVHVSHPLEDRFVYADDHVTLAFNPAKRSFADVERDYYNSIAVSDFHTVCNSLNGNLGYVGDSAALEVAYAIRHSRPVIFQYPPEWKIGLNPVLMQILAARRALFHVVDLMTEAESLLAKLLEVSSSRHSYEMRADETRYIDASVERLLATLPSTGV